VCEGGGGGVVSGGGPARTGPTRSTYDMTASFCMDLRSTECLVECEEWVEMERCSFT